MGNVDAFFVHSLNVPGVRPRVREYRKRESLVHYVKVLRYGLLRRAPYEIWVNGFGTLVIFDSCAKELAKADALSLYDGDEPFDSSYERMMNYLRIEFGIVSTDVDFSLLVTMPSAGIEGPCHVGDDTVIEWSAVQLGDRDGKRVLIDALFVYQLCKLFAHMIAELPRRRSQRTFQDALVDCSDELFNLSRPERFLVSDKEIRLMAEYYRKWRLGSYIEHLRSSFNQALTNYQLYWESSVKVRETTMNLLLLTIALVSLFNVVPNVAAVIPRLEAPTASWIVVVAAALSTAALAIHALKGVLTQAVARGIKLARGRRFEMVDEDEGRTLLPPRNAGVDSPRGPH